MEEWSLATNPPTDRRNGGMVGYSVSKNRRNGGMVLNYIKNALSKKILN
jgi:predicted acetyltransferase